MRLFFAVITEAWTDIQRVSTPGRRQPPPGWRWKTRDRTMVQYPRCRKTTHHQQWFTDAVWFCIRLAEMSETYENTAQLKVNHKTTTTRCASISWVCYKNVHWLLDWSPDWLTNCLIGYLIDGLIDWLVEVTQSADQLSDPLSIVLIVTLCATSLQGMQGFCSRWKWAVRKAL